MNAASLNGERFTIPTDRRQQCAQKKKKKKKDGVLLHYFIFFSLLRLSDVMQAQNWFKPVMGFTRINSRLSYDRYE